MAPVIIDYTYDRYVHVMPNGIKLGIPKLNKYHTELFNRLAANRKFKLLMFIGCNYIL